MEYCSKMIWRGTEFAVRGAAYKEECGRPVFKDGLCSQHYHRLQERLKPWSERKGYRPINQDEFDRGVSMKLANSNNPTCYYNQNGVIMKEERIKRTDRYTRVKTDLQPVIENFVVKRD